MNSIICGNCEKIIDLTDKQRRFISESWDKGMSFIMLECNHCSKCFEYNPLSPGRPLERANDVYHICPVSDCEGAVVEVDDFWGCGTCGNIWGNETMVLEALKARGS